MCEAREESRSSKPNYTALLAASKNYSTNKRIAPFVSIEAMYGTSQCYIIHALGRLKGLLVVGKYRALRYKEKCAECGRGCNLTDFIMTCSQI